MVIFDIGWLACLLEWINKRTLDTNEKGLTSVRASTLRGRLHSLGLRRRFLNLGLFSNGIRDLCNLCFVGSRFRLDTRRIFFSHNHSKR